MPTPPLIDIDALIVPLAGETPAGSTVPFVLRKKMDDARKEVNPDSFAPDDPRRPEQPVLADWPAIRRMTEEGLANTSKDLMLAARLTEALVKLEGFAGARDGFQLLQRLVGECWDRIHPIIEDNDLEPRAAAFNWLGDENRGAFFPNTLRQVPLVRTDDAAYSWQNWRDLQDGKGKVEQADFDKAVALTTREACASIVEDLQGSLKELDALGQLLDAKMGDHSPSLAEIRRALTDVQDLMQGMLARKGPAPVDVEEASDAPADTVAASTPGVPAAEKATGAGRMRTRDEVYARLAEASAMLLQMEPHSPVAYMIQRAVKLGHLSLPELIKVLVRDQEVLNQLNRDLDLGYDKNE